MMLASAGCKSIGKATFKEPVVTLQNVQLNGLGLTGGSLDVILNVYNPNGFNLDATRMTYRLMVDSIPFGTGLVESRFTVGGKDSSLVRIPLDFTYSGIGEAGRQLLNTGSINYRVLGDVTVGTPLGNFTVPYDRNGRFSAMSGRR
jgi:LEA14-like dessication related protein